MYPDCHAQEAVQGNNKSVSPVPNGFNILGGLSFALLAHGLLLKNTLPRLLLNDEAKSCKILLPVCCEWRATVSFQSRGLRIVEN